MCISMPPDGRTELLHLTGVPWAWVFDNMKTVTLGRDAAGRPRWNPGFWRFATEVGFHPELCDPGAGQQKGSVENLVKWVKTNFLPGRHFVDDEDLAQQSVTWERDKAVQISQAHGQRPVDLLAPERAAFGPLTTTPDTYGLYRVATVHRESLVRVDGNQYSVPVGHGGQAVDVRILRDGIRISRDGVRLAEHARLAGIGQRRRDPVHYTAALADLIAPADLAYIETRHYFAIVNELPLDELVLLDDRYLWGKVQTGTIGNGDLIYFPDHWAHYVQTTQHSFGFGGYLGEVPENLFC
jgi:hypothetical protein